MEYRRAGVDQRKGDKLVQWLKESKGAFKKNFKNSRNKKILKTTGFTHYQENLISGIGGYSALFRAKFSDMSSPCLVSTTDGVGTKLKLASYFESYEEVGQDLVAMCVNDLLCMGAFPLFFLDYLACSRLDLKVAKRFLKGVQEACLEAQCALVGGETAEMPGFYKKKDFDCAGFAVGVVDEKHVLGAHRVQIGDELIALQSSGFHSNGFSLLRKVFKKSFDLKQWKKRLLKPTFIYGKAIQGLFLMKELHAVAHITGGGMDNLLRVLPDKMEIQLKAWKIPSPFLEVKARIKISEKEFLRVFNCGVGMVLFVDKRKASYILNRVRSLGWGAFRFGKVTASQRGKKRWIVPKGVF